MDYTSLVPENGFTWDRRKPHPMCIPHIVDTILGNLSVSDLKSCRLVSSQYNEIACKALQREETIIFKTIPQLETYLSNIKPIAPPPPPSSLSSSSPCASCVCLEDLVLSAAEEEQDDVEVENVSKSGGNEDWPSCLDNHRHRNYQDDYEAFSSSPYQYCLSNQHQYRYSHCSFHFDYCDPKSEIEQIDQFFAIFGSQIRRLKYTTDLLPFNFPQSLGHMGDIWQDRLCNLNELVLEMKWGVPAHLFASTTTEDQNHQVLLPSLRKLHLDVLLTDRDADRAELFIRQLLSITPNLVEISIPGSKRFFDDYINVVLARVILSSELPRLSTLNFCLALSDAQMRLLALKNLPLSRLILDLEDLQFDDEMGAGGGGNNLNNFQNDENMEQDNFEDVQDNNNQMEEEDDFRHEFLRQNPNRRPSFTPITKSTLQRFLTSLTATLCSLHICFPQSPRHSLHTFMFQQEMTELKFLALGYFAGSSRILDHLPALKKLELWNVQFRDCHGHDGKVVPEKYNGITSVIS